MTERNGSPLRAIPEPRTDARVRDTSGQDILLDPAPRQRKRRRLLILAGGGAVALIIVVIFIANAWITSKVVIPRERVRIATVTRGLFIRDVAADGTVVVANSPTLVAAALGTVTFNVVAGDPVKVGQVLAVVNSPSLKNELAQEKATLDGLIVDLERQQIETRQQMLASKEAIDLATTQVRATEREYERLKSGLEQGVIPRRDVDKAGDAREDAQLTYAHAVANAKLEEESLDFDLKTKRTDVERQKLLVADLMRRVNALVVRSPVKGMVGARLVDQQATVAENAPLLTVVDLSALQVQFSVAESYASDLGLGMFADIEYNGETYPGKVTSISPEVQEDEVKGRLRFTGHIPPGLRENQRVSVRIILDRRDNVLKVERGAFVDAGSYVYKVNGSLATRQPVQLGDMSVGEVEILSGLQAGDQIIVSSVSDFGDAPQVRLSD